MLKQLIYIAGMSTLLMANEASTLFNAKCAMCHVTSRPSDMSTLVAPPIMGVMNHVKMTYPNKADAVKFIVDYVQEPSKSKAVCMPQKIQRFGLMPSQKGNVTPALKLSHHGSMTTTRQKVSEAVAWVKAWVAAWVVVWGREEDFKPALLPK